MPFFDLGYLLFMVPVLLLSIYAQWRVGSAYRKYANVRNAHNLTGVDVARVLMRNEDLSDVGVEMIPGDLTDHYDPAAKVIRLSLGSAQTPSVAAMAVVAHELGHAQQDRVGYAWLQVRAGLVGIANIGSQLGMVLFFIGLVLSTAMRGPFGMGLAWAGVVLLSAAVVFSLVTLPVEFNASARARTMLERNGLMTLDERRGVNEVLDAAALTYVATAAQSVMQLLYWVMTLLGRR